jgi:hypothetical protein
MAGHNLNMLKALSVEVHADVDREDFKFIGKSGEGSQAGQYRSVVTSASGWSETLR